MTEAPASNAAPVDAILDSLLGRITSADKAKSNLKILVYSEPGARKTSFLGTCPNNLIVDVEKGLASLRTAPNVDMSKLSVLPYRSFFQIEALVEKMNMGVPQLAQFETLSIDSVSELHKKGLEEVTKREFAKGGRVSQYNAETEDHTENNEHIRRLVSSLRDLDRNIILTAHARTVQQKDKSIKIYPDFSERLANTIAGIVDVVAFVQLRENDDKTEAVWHFESDGFITAKQRIGLPKTLIDPTWDTIWGYFEKHQAPTKS